MPYRNITEDYFHYTYPCCKDGLVESTENTSRGMISLGELHRRRSSYYSSVCMEQFPSTFQHSPIAYKTIGYNKQMS